jgi:hypothetical protein
MTASRFARLTTALMTAGVFTLGGVLSAVPAQAASTCAWSHGVGGSTCVGTSWTGAKTGSTRVSHGDGTSGVNLCRYKAQIRGTLSTGGSWSKTSGTSSGCTPVTAWMDISSSVTLRHGSLFYGQFYHDGAWAPGSPALTIIS